MPKAAERFILVIEPMARCRVDVIARLKWLLKAAKRHGLRCVSCTRLPPKDGS